LCGAHSFFQHTAAPYFVPPVATLMSGNESFLYAHSITRQYGFLVIQLSLVAALFATQPERYAPFIRLLAGARLLMASLGTYSFASGAVTLWQLLPSLTIDIGLAIALWRLAPKAEKPLIRTRDSANAQQEILFWTLAFALDAVACIAIPVRNCWCVVDSVGTWFNGLLGNWRCQHQ